MQSDIAVCIMLIVGGVFPYVVPFILQSLETVNPNLTYIKNSLYRFCNLTFSEKIFKTIYLSVYN